MNRQEDNVIEKVKKESGVLNVLVKAFLEAEVEWKAVDDKIVKLAKERDQLASARVRLGERIADRLGIGSVK